MKINNIFSNKIKYLTDEGRPRSFIRTGGGVQTAPTGAKRTLTNLRLYWEYYSGEGTIFAAINTTVWNTIMTGINVISDNDEARMLVKKYLEDLKLESIFRQATLQALVFGDGFIEKIYAKDNTLTRLKVIDGRTILINSDEFGDVVNYYQEIAGQKLPEIDPEYIIHIRFFEIPGSPYGISLIGPNKDTIDRKVSTDDALFNAIKRHGTLKWVASVGSEKDGQIPPESVMNDIKAELEDIQYKNEFVVPWFIKLNTIDEQGIQGVEEYFNYFQTQLIIGLLCPEESLGLGRGSTESTARVKAIMYERMIKSFQHELENLIKDELIDPFLEENGFEDVDVYLRFKQVTEEDEALRAKWLGGLLRGFRDRDMPFTRNEIRSFFGLEPREDMEDVPVTRDEEEPKEDEEEEDVEEEEREDEE